MRCATRPALDCPTPERCEILGCSPPIPGGAVMPERRPIDLPPLEDLDRIGLAGRAAVRIHHAFDRLRRVTEEHAAMSDRPATPAPPPVQAAPFPAPPIAAPLPPQPRPAPSPPPPDEDIRVVRIGGGWVIYRGRVPVDVGADRQSIGAKVTALLPAEP